jgi:hypothetical protein
MWCSIMTGEQVKCKLWRKLFRHAPVAIFLFIVIAIVWQIQKPSTAYQYKRQFAYTSPFFHPKESSQDEKRIARHFAADTLPGLMQKGLIRRYLRSASGTSIAVDGKLWKKRSKFFKTSLLTEVSVFNKVQGYELSTRITDNFSGKLYAYLSPEAKIDFYD